KLRVFELGRIEVKHIVAIYIADTCGSNRCCKGHTRNSHSSRSCDQSGYVRVNIRIDRQCVHDDLYLVVKALGEQGTQWTVNETSGQDLTIRGLALTLEITTRNTAGSISFFDVIYSQREKIKSVASLAFCDYSGQHNGIFYCDQH